MRKKEDIQAEFKSLQQRSDKQLNDIGYGYVTYSNGGEKDDILKASLQKDIEGFNKMKERMEYLESESKMNIS